MWEGKRCPVCNVEMIRRNIFGCDKDGGSSGGHIISCPLLAKDRRPHYELHFKANESSAYYETGIVYPFLIESYIAANSNIYKWNEAEGVFSRKVILDVPYIQIPWGDLEAAKSKLKLYLLMS